jgi:hypothetical protein
MHRISSWPSCISSSHHLIQAGQSWRVLTPSMIGPHQTLTFWDTLRRWGGEWMMLWSSMFFDDGTSNILWLANSLHKGNLIWVTDGSNDHIWSPIPISVAWGGFSATRSPDALWQAGSQTPAAAIIKWKCWVCALCIMFWFLPLKPILAVPVHWAWLYTVTGVDVDCANQVVWHIKPCWACGDILCSFRNIWLKIFTALSFEYVESHMDDHIPWGGYDTPTTTQLNATT